ncbi:hypothetical protein PUMCH_004171 [Australozyma saopauloensis]|uniref:Meiotically up-regulated protein Msb1/Mug8 domain-containing protein n=1 Tax=Australozyma saopauloensis TaxID=291208 RepID=A0AAX4HE68_9ASCO|nr:hypothetical protein PUMCH_004171 [[Candida] saopauloensis]
MKNHIDLPAIPPSQEKELTAIGKDQLTRKKLQGLLHLITADLKARGTKTPHVFLPYRSRVDDSKLELFLSRVFPNGVMIDVSREPETRALLAEFDEFTLTCGLKFLWCRLPNNEIIGWDVYQEFKRKEHEAGYPKDAFLTIMPKCLSSASHASIVYDFLDLLISLSANSQYNHLNGQKISKMASIWAFSCAPKLNSAFYDATMIREVSFLDGLEAWKKLSNGLFHLLLSFLRAMLPDTEAETLNLPKTLQSLLISNTYPPPEDKNPVKSVITIPCVHVRSTRKSTDPYELLSKIRHTLRFDKKDAFLSIENYTILKNIFQKESTSEIISTLTEESRRCLSRLTANLQPSNYNVYPGWARLSSGVNPNIPLYSDVTISSVTLQDYYIWTWLSSLGSDQSASMKSLFGRSIVVEAGLRGFQKWMIITETTILSDEYISMFKSPTNAKDLPLPPVVKVPRHVERSQIPEKEDQRPPPPVEKDSLLSEITSAIDSIGLEDRQQMSDYQVYLNSLAASEQRTHKDVPAKTTSPLTTRNQKDRPRPPPLDLKTSALHVKPPSPKKAPHSSEPVERTNPLDYPEFQGYKVYAKELSLLPEREKKKLELDIPLVSANMKTSHSFEIPERSYLRMASESHPHHPNHHLENEEPPSRLPERDNYEASQDVHQPATIKPYSMVDHVLKDHHPVQDSHTRVPQEYGTSRQARSGEHPNMSLDENYDDHHANDTVQYFGADRSFERIGTERSPDRSSPNRSSPARESPNRPFPHQQTSNLSVPNREDESPVRANGHEYQYNDGEIEAPQVEKKKKKKKKKRRDEYGNEFAMPKNLPAGPPPPMPTMGNSYEEFNGSAEPNGAYQNSQFKANVPQAAPQMGEIGYDRTNISEPAGGYYAPEQGKGRLPEQFPQSRGNSAERMDYRNDHNHIQVSQPPYDGHHESQVGNTTYQLTNSGGENQNHILGSVNTMPPGHHHHQPHVAHQNGQSYEQNPQDGYQQPVSYNQQSQHNPQLKHTQQPQHFQQTQHTQPPPQNQLYPPQGQGRTPSHGQSYHQHPQYPQGPPRQALGQHPGGPPGHSQMHPQGQSNVASPPANYPQDTHNPSMQWQQPQNYGPPPQGYGPPPQGYGPPPQGYGVPPQGGYAPPMAQPMYYPPQQGYFPPPQQFQKPRPKPTTSELTMMNMPMSGGFKKNQKQNKAGMRAALNQGTFGI